MCYTLPKIWLGRIQKYWDKILPSDYPVSSSQFSLSFETEEQKDAVVEMENQLGSDESVVLTLIPEGTVVTNYVGTYDVTGDVGALTLLSPEKVNVPVDKLLVMHFVNGAWSKVEDIQIIDGYVWGVLDSFSPIAVFEYKKDIHLEESVDFLSYPAIVCEGNTVQIKTNDNNNPVVVNPSTGKEFEITKNTLVIGGSVDGTPIESTNIAIIDLEDNAGKVRLYAGSAFYNAENPEECTTVGTINVTAVNSTLRGITGSHGCVRTNEVNIKVDNCVLKSHVGAGESYVSKKKKDVNGPNPTFASPAWVKTSNININNSKVYIVYGAGNNGYLYVDEANLTVDGLTACAEKDYFCPAGSNGYTKKAKLNLNNSELRHISCNNRGGVGSLDITVTDSKVPEFYIGGDNSEGDVDATIESIKVNINAGDGEYHIKLGVNGTTNITSEQVESVKISRNAGVVEVDENVITMLGNKYVIK